MKGPALMGVKPPSYSGTLVDGVIVEDRVNELAGWHRGLDPVQETDEFLMPVALHAAADDLAFEYVEGGEQRGRAVALIVVRHGPQAAGLQRQARLRAVERLDLMGWMAPSLHRRAMLVAVEGHRSEEPS